MLRSGGAWIAKSVCGGIRMTHEGRKAATVFVYGCNLAAHYVGPSMEMIKGFLWLNQKEEYDCEDFRLNSY